VCVSARKVNSVTQEEMVFASTHNVKALFVLQFQEMKTDLVLVEELMSLEMLTVKPQFVFKEYAHHLVATLIMLLVPSHLTNVNIIVVCEVPVIHLKISQ